MPRADDLLSVLLLRGPERGAGRVHLQGEPLRRVQERVVRHVRERIRARRRLLHLYGCDSGSNGSWRRGSRCWFYGSKRGLFSYDISIERQLLDTVQYDANHAADRTRAAQLPSEVQPVHARLSVFNAAYS